ncbi:hypothetical protein EDD86DRAFT_59879 [Gorgonomyces haynaldii]|nr:hypothetical protein EDD86DRAFT_59879 [Gorgonomyces haynaldii]
MSALQIVSSITSQVASGKPVWKLSLPAAVHGPHSALEGPAGGMFSNAAALKALNKVDTLDDPRDRIACVLQAICDPWIQWSAEKPFNPVLGEFIKMSTKINDNGKELYFEYCIEQISHHPPKASFRLTGPNFTLHTPHGVDAISGFHLGFNHVDISMKDAVVLLETKRGAMETKSPGIRIEPIFGSKRTVGFQGDVFIKDWSGVVFSGTIEKKKMTISGQLKDGNKLLHRVHGDFKKGIYYDQGGQWVNPLSHEPLQIIVDEATLNDPKVR